MSAYTLDQRDEALTLAAEIGPVAASARLGIPRRLIESWARPATGHVLTFRPQLIDAIARQRKTQTRRLVVAGESECRWRKGRSYGVRAPGGNVSIRVVVTDVRRERLGDLTFEDARAEGFRSRDEFFEYWEDLHGELPLDFPVWVITFVLDRGHHSRLLARSPERGEPYVESPHHALRDEGEAPEEWRTDDWADEARQRDDERRRERRALQARVQRERKSLEQRLADARREARRSGVNVGAKLRVLERHLVQLEQQVFDRNLDEAA